jgi:serine/threonine-protein kinase HipA
MRIPFIFAMMLFGRNENNKEGASCLEITDVINRESARPGLDRLELWRRMIFNAITGNIDDYQLVFDHRAKSSFVTCLELATHFTLTKPVIELALKKIGESLRHWQLIVKRHQVCSDEIKRMALPFDHEDSQCQFSPL